MPQFSDVMTKLDAIVAERSLLKHPFYQNWTEGSLSLERLRHYAVQYYRHVEAFPRYLSAIHSRCADIATRQAVLENLIEEERGPENHPELWLRFAEGLGVSRAEVLAAPPLPETSQLVSTFMRISHEQSVPEGLAAIYSYESQIPAVAAAKIDGLKRFYGISDGRSLAFFTVHQQADVYHAQTGAELIERHADSPVLRQAALEAARSAVDALWHMLDGVYV